MGATGGPVTKAQLLAASGHPPAVPTRFGVDSLRVQQVGDVALVTSRRVDRRTLGGYESVATWRVLDALGRRAGRQRLVHHTQTWLVSPVTPVAAGPGLAPWRALGPPPCDGPRDLSPRLYHFNRR